MTHEPGQLKTSPLRAALGGISLLLLVAVAVQSSPGERADAVRHHGPVVRLIAQAVTRQMDRQVRRQDERPVVAAAHPAVTSDRNALRCVPTPDLVVEVRALSPWLTDLPPPAMA
jgi:hypothetical protein